MRRTLLLLPLLLLVVAQLAFADLKFPDLTGRVVDQAGLLTQQQKAQLTAQLAAEEKASSNQLVVVTLKSLQGDAIADYGYQLGRHWGIGQKGRDNGALLIVAPNERKVRIEVGYGLEGSLTDALSDLIIRNDIIPSFKKGNYFQGIEAGVTSIIQVIHGQYKAKTKEKGPSAGNIVSLVIFLVFISLMFSGRGGIFAMPFLIGGGGFGGGGFGGGGFGGGGFGGGGGGFGGGGASGGW
jgi:uncharacterized protein